MAQFNISYMMISLIQVSDSGRLWPQVINVFCLFFLRLLRVMSATPMIVSSVYIKKAGCSCYL